MKYIYTPPKRSISDNYILALCKIIDAVIIIFSFGFCDGTFSSDQMCRIINKRVTENKKS